MSGRRILVHFRTSWLEATFALQGQDLGSKLKRGKCWLGCRREAGTLARAFSVCSALFLAGPQFPITTGTQHRFMAPLLLSKYLTCSVWERWCLAPDDSSGENETYAGSTEGRKTHFSPPQSQETKRNHSVTQAVQRADVQTPTPYRWGHLLLHGVQEHWLSFVPGWVRSYVGNTNMDKT